MIQRSRSLLYRNSWLAAAVVLVLMLIIGRWDAARDAHARQVMVCEQLEHQRDVHLDLIRFQEYPGLFRSDLYVTYARELLTLPETCDEYLD